MPAVISERIRAAQKWIFDLRQRLMPFSLCICPVKGLMRILVKWPDWRLRDFRIPAGGMILANMEFDKEAKNAEENL
jgi:hypothetical protein